MSGLADTYDTGGRQSTLLWASLLFVGGFVAAAGLAAAAASVVAGFGTSPATAVDSGVLFAGATLLALYATLAARAATGRRRAVAALGAIVATGGLALFWAVEATTFAAVPPGAIAAYVVGAVVVLWAVVTADGSVAPARGASAENDSTASVSGVVGTRPAEQADTATTTHVGTDGGDEDDDLEFFDE